MGNITLKIAVLTIIAMAEENSNADTFELSEYWQGYEGGREDAFKACARILKLALDED